MAKVSLNFLRLSPFVFRRKREQEREREKLARENLGNELEYSERRKMSTEN